MVASISARGGAQAALGYYGHLGQDDYYLRGHEPPGGWAGEAAARLSLDGPVVRSEFEAALNGIDPKTGERLTSLGGRQKSHSAGWDMTFSAPKSVSVLWALSDADQRVGIEIAQRSAVTVATKHLEQTAAYGRRGKGGAIREPTAGLLLAKFDHHTSRDLDPQLHTHVFVFNLAPRKDGTWGAIVSRELYKAQKQAGAIYREALAIEIERQGYVVERTVSGFHVAAIPRRVERTFSKRREAIEAATDEFGYRSPKGMEMAALRTRKAKRSVGRDALFATWRSEALAMGYELNAAIAKQHQPGRTDHLAHVHFRVPSDASRIVHEREPNASLLAATNKLAAVARAVDQRASLPSSQVDLKQRDREKERG